jgi:hypothetical protein
LRCGATRLLQRGTTRTLGSMFAATAVTIAGLLSGGIVGIVFGFGLASHKDVLAGIRPTKANRFIQWLARPSKELTSSETLIAFVLVLVWVGSFFFLCAVPIIVAAKIAGEASWLRVYGFGVFLITGLLAKYLGARLWQRVI